MKKNNQALSHFSYKNDDLKLSEVGEFLRSTLNYKVLVDCFILFDKESGKYVGYAENLPENPKYTFRRPDLMLIDKKTKKLILCVEDDGTVHKYRYADTEERNKQYGVGGVLLLPLDTTDVKTNYFDYFYQKITEILGE